jgi:cysteine-rich repeat protein
MVVKKAWMAVATLLAFAALPACATSNVGTTATSSGTGAGGDEGVGGSTSSVTSSTGTGGKAPVVCGDGSIDKSEVCDDGNNVDGDGCSATCEFEMGWDCSGADITVCTAKCGDGFLVGKEACDDGNNTKSDGCSDTCTVDNGYACTGAPSACTTVCGDGILAGNEECDNKNATAGDGCSELCKVETGWTCTGQPSTCKTTCGDGIVAGAEACDDHNFAAGDGCDSACLVEQFWTCIGEPSACTTACGDGHVLGTEICDDGNTVAGDGCGLACTPEAGFTCTGMPSKCVTTCGDGVAVAGLEICDDGNTSNGDGCNAVCKVEPGFICMGTTPTKCNTVCGDGYAAGAETCDVGPFKPNDGCDDTCHAEHGYVCNNFPSVCQTVCGDGVVGGTEACDNGGLGQGCSASCTVIPGWTCTGEPSVCITSCGDGILAGNETCDDGNLVNGDCCSNVCGSEVGCEIEANNSIPTANDFNALAISTTVKGTIKPAGDLDYYLVTIPAGQTVVLNAATLDGFNSSCVNLTQDSVLTVYDVNGVSLGTDDNSGPGNCAQLQVVSLAAGDYFVEVKAGAGTPQFSYALTLQVQIVICGNGTKEPGEQCDDGNTANGDGCSSTCHFEVTNEIEPNNTAAQALANPIFPANQLWTGAITPIGDNDYYRIHLNTTSDLRIQTFDGNGPGSCVGIDTVLYLYGPNGTTQLATNDQGGIASCSLIDSNVAASFPGARHLAPGDYYVRVQRWLDTAVIGAYDVAVTYNAVCGNGVLEGAEQCDGGANCSVNCDILPTCGDNFISVGEQCEDGNTVSGDGCSATCQFEPGYTCTSTLPNVCTAIISCPMPGQLVTYTSANVPQPVLDNLTATSTLSVPTVGNVTAATLLINISHTWDSDMNIKLKSPTGAAGIDISSGNGSSGDNYTNTLFSDSCAAAITSGTAPFSGCYHPEAAMASFNGTPANGTWTLTVADTATGDTGTLNSWQLTLCVQ